MAWKKIIKEKNSTYKKNRCCGSYGKELKEYKNVNFKS